MLLVGPLLTWELLSRFGPWPRWLFPGPRGGRGEPRARCSATAGSRAAVGRSLARLAQGYALSAPSACRSASRMARSEAVRRGAAARSCSGCRRSRPSAGCRSRSCGSASPRPRSSSSSSWARSSRSRSRPRTPSPGVDPVLLRAAGTLGIRGPRFHLGVLLPAALPGILTGPEARLELRLARAHGGRAALRRGRPRAAPPGRARAPRRGAGDGRDGGHRRDRHGGGPGPLPRSSSCASAGAGASLEAA